MGTGFLSSARLLIPRCYVSIDIVFFPLYQHTDVVSSLFDVSESKNGCNGPFSASFEAMRALWRF